MSADGYGSHRVCVRIAAIADLPSRFGDFQVVAFYNNRDDKEHAAFVRGDVCYSEDVPLRLHSECLTPNPPKDTDGRREESGRGVRELQGK